MVKPRPQMGLAILQDRLCRALGAPPPRRTAPSTWPHPSPSTHRPPLAGRLLLALLFGLVFCLFVCCCFFKEGGGGCLIHTAEK